MRKTSSSATAPDQGRRSRADPRSWPRASPRSRAPSLRSRRSPTSRITTRNACGGRQVVQAVAARTANPVELVSASPTVPRPSRRRSRSPRNAAPLRTSRTRRSGRVARNSITTFRIVETTACSTPPSATPTSRSLPGPAVARSRPPKSFAASGRRRAERDERTGSNVRRTPRPTSSGSPCASRR